MMQDERRSTQAMASNPAPVRLSARERLLTAASELFYEQGVQNVGIDRVIERAGVAKASLYNTYGSKDELVKAYLASRQARQTERIGRALERATTPREKLLAVFDAQAELFDQPGFNGCAFIGAAGGAPRDPTVEHATDAYRAWVRALLTELATEAGAPDPGRLARELQMLYDGAAVSAKMDRDPGAAAFARAAAEALLDGELAD
jgi:AcrR family transcriptional regulator